MANRSYLYAVDAIPNGDVAAARVIGIAEWSYDIPLAFKLLVSGTPRRCRSLILETEETLAICGDYDVGVHNLLSFLDLLDDRELKPLRDEAAEFLGHASRRRKLIVLEAFEIFDMIDEEPDAQVNELLSELVNLGIETVAESRSGQGKLSILGKLRALLNGQLAGRRLEVPIKRFGLGSWSQDLFYDPKESP